MRILFIGDIYGQPGRRVVRDHVADIVTTRRIDLVVANGENAAAGFGITPNLVEELLACGIAVLTSGNHIWDKRELAPWWTSGVKQPGHACERLLRPANFGEALPGAGLFQGRTQTGEPFAVINLQGRVYMTPLACPFRTADALLAKIPAHCRTILVDFHAEATSEKQALGWYLDGRVTAVLGTHTHVPTADERILPKGTGFQTDVGMTGSYAGVIGSRVEDVLQRLLQGYPAKLEPSDGDVRICGTLIETGAGDFEGRALSIERFQLRKTD
ncbi:MAG TPA: TIGR00282 family metallophosphoesterase [Terriglobales bacterium]|nr:TIGR00282 family metallophosphoesterase [Terriglobales bacterium]